MPSRLNDLIVTRWGARFCGRAMPVAIGRGGFSTNKREGDGASPVGVWSLTEGYWRADRGGVPYAPLPFRPSGPRDRWSDDPRDPAYNSAVSGTDWPWSHERMRRGDQLYDVVLVTNHNSEPAIPGDGSAIFVHCWRRVRFPTAGCIAFRESDLRWIIARWQVQSRLVICE